MAGKFSMATIIVSDVKGLTAALASAKGGDIIKLGGGDYGDFSIKGKIFATDVTITSLSTTTPAEFHSLSVTGSQGINFVNINVDFQPTETTMNFSSAVKISGSTDISFVGGEIKGGPAVNGVPQTATELDKTGNVIGLPTGRGMTIENSKQITIEKVEIYDVHRGLVMSKSTDLVIKDNNIHDVRTSPIVGGGLSRVTIEGNHVHDATPFRWGSVDHADFIHIWTDPGSQTGASTDIRIVNNVIEQGEGEAILGIYLDDNLNKLGFSNVTISNNLIMNGNGQGIRLENVFDSQITNNTLLQTSGTFKDAPGIKITFGSHDLQVSGNFASYITPDAGSVGIKLDGNTIVQTATKLDANFYSASDLDAVDDLTPAAAHDYISKLVANWTSSTLVDQTLDLSKVTTLDSDVGIKVGAKLASGDMVIGGRGSDTLTGRAGHDTLVGGAGNDLLSGDGGHDALSGGLGADTFNFGGDYPTAGGVDTILDFSRLDGDKIKLHSIDANTSTTTNDAFRFIGTDAFHRVAGELRYVVENGQSVVMGDVNGDGSADFTIKVVGATTLTGSDFIL
jgi:Ca2+-binding RTX toxin-like protein